LSDTTTAELLDLDRVRAGLAADKDFGRTYHLAEELLAEVVRLRDEQDQAAAGELLEYTPDGLTAEQQLRDRALGHAARQLGAEGDCDFVAADFDTPEEQAAAEREIAAGALVTISLAEHYRRYLETGEVPVVPDAPDDDEEDELDEDSTPAVVDVQLPEGDKSPL
jgi:hypothetical protein